MRRLVRFLLLLVAVAGLAMTFSDRTRIESKYSVPPPVAQEISHREREEVGIPESPWLVTAWERSEGKVVHEERWELLSWSSAAFVGSLACLWLFERLGREKAVARSEYPSENAPW
jgi:hypothetical protein